ncbi:MAG: hypothetical protein Q9175_002181 [Cornicularia normoerica]
MSSDYAQGLELLIRVKEQVCSEPDEPSICETDTTKSSNYAQALELLTRVQEQVNDIKLEAMKDRINIQKLYAFGQNWDLLRMALNAASEAADKAVTARDQQFARHRTYAHVYVRTGQLRNRHADACLSQFRYVTALSDHTRALGQYHESELLSLANIRDHYEEALGPQAHVIPSHQTFLDTLGRDIEALKRTQGLEVVYIRWIQSRAAADLKQQATRFHLTSKRLHVRRRRAEKACKRDMYLRIKMKQHVKEHEHLKRVILNVQRTIQAL